MADNTVINTGTGGDTVATDDLATLNGSGSSGVKVQRVKVGYGSDGDFRDIDLTHGIPIQGSQTAVQTTNWTSATAVNTANSVSIIGMNTVTVAMSNTSTMTAGVLTFEVSPNAGTNWFSIAMVRIDSYTVESTYTLNTVANRAWATSVDGWTDFRVRLSTVITGTGTATTMVSAQTMPIEPMVAVGQTTASLLNGTMVLAAGAASIGNVGTVTAVTSITTSLTPGVAANNLGKAEDAVAASGDTGVMALAVQRAAPASNVSGTGDYAELQTSPANGLFVAPTPIQVELNATPTISTTPAYTVGDQVGAVLTFTGAALASGRAGQIVGARILDKGKQSATLALDIYAVSPTLVGADNAAYDITDANMGTAVYVGTIDFLAGNYKPTASNSRCVGSVNAGAPILAFNTSGSANLFGVLSTTSTPTYTSTTDLIVYLSIIQY